MSIRSSWLTPAQGLGRTGLKAETWRNLYMVAMVMTGSVGP